MFSENVQENQVEQLNQLRLYMDKLEFESRIIKQSEEMPTNILLVAITDDYKNRKRFINFSFEQILEKVLSRCNLLEFRITLPSEIGVHNRFRHSVEKLLLVINNRMEVGYFGMQENGKIYLRYVYTTHRIHGINEEQLLETVLLYIAMLDMYEQLIEKVSNGTLSVEGALKLLKNKGEFSAMAGLQRK